MTEGPTTGAVRVGLISDTHGWLDPRAVVALTREAPLAGIIHAGDIGADHVLYELGQIARVTAVRGNCDMSDYGFDLGTIARTTLGGKVIAVVHDIYDLVLREDDDIVVHGHSHRPRTELEHGVLYLNPGSATQRRSQPSCSVGILEIAQDGTATAHIEYLDELGPRIRS